MEYTSNITEMQDDIVNYLLEHDNDFPISISKKVNITTYSQKISERGKGILALYKRRIVGLVFYYDNNEIEKKGFISLVSVDARFRKKGIASYMLNKVIEDMKSKMEYCQVPTHISNEKAINLYNSFGFELTGKPDEDGNILLIKKL